jgi:hypothetical protein
MVLKTMSPRRLQSPSPAVLHPGGPDQVFTSDHMEWEKSKMTPPKWRTMPAGIVVTYTGTGVGRTFQLELSHPQQI